MDNTQRMIRLLGRLRREMNGAVAESMRCYGRDYGLNYGVSIPTIRAIAREDGCDDGFARYLYVQQVRELRLAALHLADASLLNIGDADFWAAGIINSEVAEEAAFALLGRIDAFDELFRSWCNGGTLLEGYAAVMAAARREDSLNHIDTAAAWLRRVAASEEHSAARLAGRGVATLFVACGSRNEENRLAVFRVTGSLGTSPAEDCVHEEVTAMLGE